VSQWSDKERRLSPESSAEPGRWRTARAPYLEGVLNVVNEKGITEACWMKSAQVGATESLNNIVGYFIDQDPAPILLVQPTLEMGQAWSKDRLAPMLRDTPALRDKVKDSKSRDSGNTMLHKTFPGGHITISGANSPASLASRPIRITLFDEVDRFPPSAGTEGDPIKLGRKRSTTYHNRFSFEMSTPTDQNSRIAKSFENSDQRYYMMPCPHCDEKIKFIFDHLHWPKDDNGNHLPMEAKYYCQCCGGEIDDAMKRDMLARGEWVATKPFNGRAGFHINELYSPWVRFSEMAASFVEAYKDPELLKTFTNTSLGEIFIEGGEGADAASLISRCEQYEAEVPDGVVLLTAGVDVQDDRLEIEVVGWGESYESWNIDYRAFYGDTSKPDVWKQLDTFLQRDWQSASRGTIRIAGTGIDTGYRTQTVYEFCATRWSRRVFAMKGIGTVGTPVVNKPSRVGPWKTRLFGVGTNSAKSAIYARLRIASAGPGFSHFPASREQGYFDMLTAEHAVQKKLQGKMVRVYVLKKDGTRNEALDCRVYAFAAYEILGGNIGLLSAAARAASVRKGAPAQQQSGQGRVGHYRPKPGGFIRR